MPGEIGGVMADGIMASGAIGTTVGPISGISGEPAVEPNAVKADNVRRGK